MANIENITIHEKEGAHKIFNFFFSPFFKKKNMESHLNMRKSGECKQRDFPRRDHVIYLFI